MKNVQSNDYELILYPVREVGNPFTIIQIIICRDIKKISINNNVIDLSINREYTYKKISNKKIAVNCIESFIKFIKDSSNKENVFHYSTKHFLKSFINQ